MRRKEREITDVVKLEEVIKACSCCRVGFYDEGQVYIVPVNFGYIKREGQYTFYFHGAQEGRKMDLIRKNPEVGFEMDTNYDLKTAEAACGYSAYFQSIIGNGKVSIVEDDEEKEVGLRAIMEHMAGSGSWEFNEKILAAVCVWKLEAEELTGKENVR